MDLRSFGKERGLTLTSIKKLCKEKFEFIPEDLSDEQIKVLDAQLNTALKALDSGKPISAQPQEVQQTIQVVSPEKLIKARGILSNFLVETVVDVKNQVDSATNFIETYTNSAITESYVRAAKNLQAVRSEFKPLTTEEMLQSTMSQKDREELNKELELLALEYQIDQTPPQQ